MEAPHPAQGPATVDSELARLSSIERWQDTQALHVPLWQARTAYMVRLLKRELGARRETSRSLTLVEFGCATMETERALRAEGLGHFEYLPSDCFRRDERTLVGNLEDAAFRRTLPCVDVFFLAGVLEYLEDPVPVLRALAGRSRYLFFSYCPRMPHHDERVRLGWKNHYTEVEMRILARSLGAELCAEGGFDPGAEKPVFTYFVASAASAPGGRKAA